jgi:hypothetical protein
VITSNSVPYWCNNSTYPPLNNSIFICFLARNLKVFVMLTQLRWGFLAKASLYIYLI